MSVPQTIHTIREQTALLVRLAVERVATEPWDEQRYLELNFSLDRAVERHIRYRELMGIFAAGVETAAEERSWAWRLAVGLSANLTGDTPAAMQWLQDALTRLEAAGHGASPIAATTHTELARSHYYLGEYHAGLESATRALQIARSANSLLAEATAHHYLGLISLRLRDWGYAKRQIDAAQTLFERLNQRHGRARVLDSQAVLLMAHGEYARARTLLEEGLGVKQELRDLRGQAVSCGHLARVHRALGEHAEALHYLDRQYSLTSRVGDERHATEARIDLGRLHLQHGEPTRARDDLRAAWRLAEERHDLQLAALACFELAEAERRCGELKLALEASRRAREHLALGDDHVMRDRAEIRFRLLSGFAQYSEEIQEPLQRLRAAEVGPPLAEALYEVAAHFHRGQRIMDVAPLYVEALDLADPFQARQLGAMMIARSDSLEGRAWVEALLSVKHHKDELERAYADLRTAETLRDALTQMIVHDLKNPLTAIVPWLQMLQIGMLSEGERQQYLETAIDECGYLLRMIDDLNDVGKMQHGSPLELSRDSVDMTRLVNEVALRLQSRAADSGMQIRVLAHAQVPPVAGDAAKLRRVLENLLVNAIKYGRPPEGSDLPHEITLDLTLEPPPADGVSDTVRLTVTDNGPGIPLSEAERVFEPYYQAEAGRRRKAGVGLGLAFCRMVVDAQGGTIWTEANPTGGTRFCVRLPTDQQSG